MPDRSSHETEAAEPDEPAVPRNRAERRAHARGRAGRQPPATAKGGITGDQRRDAGPRMWTNRRGGG